MSTSLLQIIKVNEVRKGVSRESGKPWEMQDAECILLNDDGSPSQVGVLMIPKVIREKGEVKVGRYVGSFALQPNLSTRRIEAVLTALNPVPASQPAK